MPIKLINVKDIYIGDIITMGNGNTGNTFTEYMRVDNVQPLLYSFGFIELTVTRRWNGSPFGLFSIPIARAIFKIPNLTKIYQLNGNKIQGISRGRLVIKESSEILAVDGLGQVVVV